MRNLLFSLPCMLISEIYGFDPTYRSVFRGPHFASELNNAWLSRPSVRTSCTDCVKNTLTSLISQEYAWQNEYSIFSYEMNIDTELTKIQSVEDVFIYLHPSEDEVIKFKILPKNANKENCDFFQNPRQFDGFFCRSQKYALLLHDTSSIPAFMGSPPGDEYLPYAWDNNKQISMWAS